MDRGAAFNRRGSTRSSPFICRATHSTTRSCAPASRDWMVSRSKTTQAPTGGLPVPGLGHRARRHGPGRRRSLPRRPRPALGRSLLAEPRDHCPGRLVASSTQTSKPSGWAFEFENDNYPDIDDAAEVLLALTRTAEPSLEGGTPRAELDRRDAVA